LRCIIKVSFVQSQQSKSQLSLQSSFIIVSVRFNNVMLETLAVGIKFPGCRFESLNGKSSLSDRADKEIAYHVGAKCPTNFTQQRGSSCSPGYNSGSPEATISCRQTL
jgi:hypothetical protein